MSLPKSYSVGLFISINVCIVFIILYVFKGSIDIIYFARDLLFIYAGVIIILLKRHSRWVSSIMMFIFTFILFYLSRVFASYFDESFMTESNKYVYYTFSNKTITTILCFYGISLSSVLIGYFISYSKYKPIRLGKPFNFKSILIDKHLKKIILICVSITIPGTIYKSLFDLHLIFKYGYMILYIELPETAPAFARISWGAFSLLFPLLLIFCNNKKFFIKITLAYFAINLVSFLKGTRGELILPIIFFTWFYYNNFSKRDIKISKLLFIVVIVGFFASLMLMTRGSEFSFDILLILQMLFISQGVQYVFMGNYIDYSAGFANKSNWYILYPIVAKIFWFFNPIYSQGKTTALAKQTLSLDDQVMFATNQDAYFQGAGFGSSYIAELDALGSIYAIVIGSIILGYCINWFESNYKKNKYLVLLSWFWIPAIVWMPRGNYLIGFLFPMISIIILKFLININYKLQNKHKRYELHT